MRLWRNLSEDLRRRRGVVKRRAGIVWASASCPAHRFAIKQLFGFLDSSQIPERNIERLSPSPEYVFLNVPPRFRTFLKKSVNELICNDFCQEVTQKNHHKLIYIIQFYLENPWKGFRCISPRHWPFWYTWIRMTPYRQVNGPPWALPSKSVDHRISCANIVHS